MNIKTEKLKKTFIVILAIIVAFLVIYALFINKARFGDPVIIKYSQIKIDEYNDIDDIIDEYSNDKNKDKFISEVKRVNNLSSLSDESVYGKILYIPLIKN